jgi:hypothetical protein
VPAATLRVHASAAPAPSASPESPASPESIERPAQLAQGSVTAPLPPVRRKRPSTVEFPTLEEMPEPAAAEPLHSPIMPIQDDKPLPSIYSVIDRPRAHESPRAIGGASTERASASFLAASLAETAPALPSLHVGAGQEPIPLERESSPRRTGRRAATASRAAASFTAAEDAFFAAGEELERADQEPFADLDERPVKRPTLWRRLTGRRSL